jgi:hypothetical protein
MYGKLHFEKGLEFPTELWIYEDPDLDIYDLVNTVDVYRDKTPNDFLHHLKNTLNHYKVRLVGESQVYYEKLCKQLSRPRHHFAPTCSNNYLIAENKKLRKKIKELTYELDRKTR